MTNQRSKPMPQNNPKQEDYKAPQQGYYKATIKQEAELRDELKRLQDIYADSMSDVFLTETTSLALAEDLLPFINTYTTKLLNESLGNIIDVWSSHPELRGRAMSRGEDIILEAIENERKRLPGV